MTERNHPGFLEELTILAVATLFLLLSPLLIPLACLLHLLYQNRLRRIASSFRCEKCGRNLGPDSVTLADEEWGKIMEATPPTGKQLRRRVVRLFHAICPTCGERYFYEDHARALQRASVTGPTGAR